MARGWEDDEALPLFFVLRALACIVIPWTAVSLLRLRRSWLLLKTPARDSPKPSRSKSAAKAATKQFQGVTEGEWKSAGKPTWKLLLPSSIGSLFRKCILAFLWLWLVSVTRQYRAALAQNILYEGFDPYVILGVQADTIGSELNKAYRREAFKYHPDKNRDESAVDKFLLARKAYESLTEPEAIENFKRYGNPDGPQFVQLFAMPSFIVDKDASRVDGKKRYKPFFYRSADLQFQALGVAIALLAMVGLTSVGW